MPDGAWRNAECNVGDRKRDHKPDRYCPASLSAYARWDSGNVYTVYATASDASGISSITIYSAQGTLASHGAFSSMPAATPLPARMRQGQQQLCLLCHCDGCNCQQEYRADRYDGIPRGNDTTIAVTRLRRRSRPPHPRTAATSTRYMRLRLMPAGFQA